MPLRIIFMGTPAFSVPTLTALQAAGHQIVACYSQPPRPAGRRGLKYVPSPVQQAAETLGIEVRTPISLKQEDEQTAFAALHADVAVVVAYGLLLPKPILEGTRHGCFNGHASLLPRWRGAAPINRAIMAGDAQTGMMVMKMDVGLDIGPIAMTERVPIGPDMTAGELHDVLAERGAGLMVQAMAALETGVLELTDQPDQGTLYASKIDKAETRIDWSADAGTVHDHIRGLSPFPGAWCEMDLGGTFERVKCLASTRAGVLADDGALPGAVLPDAPLTIACGMGAVRLTRLQRAGGKPMDADDFVRGQPIGPAGVR